MAISDKQWHKLVEKYKIGRVVEVEVTNITPYRVYVNKPDIGFNGFINLTELSWGAVPQKIEEIEEFVKPKDKIAVKIIGVQSQKQKRRFNLSLRIIEHDPWENNTHKYKEGEAYPVTVLDVGKNRTLVSLEDGIAGKIFPDDIPQYEMSIKEEDDELLDNALLLAGDVTMAKIISVEIEKREIELSITEFLETKKYDNKIIDESEFEFNRE